MNSCGYFNLFYSDRDIKEIKITTGIPLHELIKLQYPQKNNSLIG